MSVKKLRLEMNHEGFQTILTSPAVMREIEKHTDRVRIAAGEGFESEVKVSTRHGSPRATGVVRTGSIRAVRAEAKHKVLTSALGGA